MSIFEKMSLKAADDMIRSYNIYQELSTNTPHLRHYIKLRPQAPWLTSDLMEEKKRKRRLERRRKQWKAIEDKEIYRNQRNRYNRMLNEAHTGYLSNLVSENSRDPKVLFKMLNTLK